MCFIGYSIVELERKTDHTGTLRASDSDHRPIVVSHVRDQNVDEAVLQTMLCSARR